MFKQEANYAKIIPGIEEAEETVRAICDGAVDDPEARLYKKSAGQEAKLPATEQ